MMIELISSSSKVVCLLSFLGDLKYLSNTLLYHSKGAIYLVLLPPGITKPDSVCLFVELCEGYHVGVSIARGMEHRITKAMGSVTMDTVTEV